MSKQFLLYTSALQDKLFRFCLRILDNYEEAQDVVQDVLEKLWREKKKIKQYNNIEAFSIKMAKNICLNRLKHQKLSVDKINSNIKTNPSFENPDYDTKELADIVKQLIGQLPQKQKMAIHLRDVEEMTFEEISEILEIDITSVRMNLSRARKTIKKQLRKIENYGL